MLYLALNHLISTAFCLCIIATALIQAFSNNKILVLDREAGAAHIHIGFNLILTIIVLIYSAHYLSGKISDKEKAISAIITANKASENLIHESETSPFNSIRNALAENRNTPNETLLNLVNDSNYEVRDHAKMTLQIKKAIPFQNEDRGDTKFYLTMILLTAIIIVWSFKKRIGYEDLLMFATVIMVSFYSYMVFIEEDINVKTLDVFLKEKIFEPKELSNSIITMKDQIIFDFY
jgi:hypothetical protein